MPDPDCPSGRIPAPGEEIWQWFDPLYEIGFGEGFDSEWWLFFYNAVGEGAGQRLMNLETFCAGDYPEDLPMEAEDLQGLDLRPVLDHWGKQYFYRRKCSCGP